MATPQQIVREVLQGKYGVGETRKQKLKAAGYSWIEIQSLINKLYGGRPVNASNEEIAKEVLEDRWGRGEDRKTRITNAGFNYMAIQNIVNQLVKQPSTAPTPQTPTTSDTTVPINKPITDNTVQSKGIDISTWQGNIDFSQVKSAGVDFIIIREGYGTTVDQKFFDYVSGAKSAGIAIPAVYHFCYSTNEAAAILEAQSCMSNVAKAGLPKSTIIFFDFEYDTIANAKRKGVTLGKQQCIAFTNAFCNTIAKQGYKAGVYCNLDYYNNMYDSATLNKYTLWLAQYTKSSPKVKCAYHQYSDKGRIAGINADVDLDTCYIKTSNSIVIAPSDGSNTAIPNTSNTSNVSLSDFTQYNGKISNCGKDEYGGISGGRAGDQSGKEWWIINWYNQGWQCILRHPDRRVREYLAELAIEAAKNDNVGYDQSQNRTYWNELQKVGYWPKKITTPCEADCSAGVIANTMAVGHLLNIPVLQNVNATYTGNMRSGFSAAGFQVLTDSKYLTSSNYLLPGDIILNDAQHTATSIGYGKNSTIPTNELKPTPTNNPNEHKVIPAMLNVRSAPGLNNKVVGQLPQGTLVKIQQTITATDGSKWYKINEGYVAAQYIS